MSMNNMRILLLTLLFCIFAGATTTYAQFREMEKLPWCPKPSATSSQTGTGTVLDALSDALSMGHYQDVVERYYPQAISQGYQRNASLYNQTRRALRQLMQGETGQRYWPQMQQLYRDRFTYIGQEEYEYRNKLDTRTWNEQQLANEQLLMLLSRPEWYEQCCLQAQRLLQQSQGKADPVWATQGMFVPINRLHAQNAERGKELLPLYRSVIEWMDATDSYMILEHTSEYRQYYSEQMLASVRDECSRVLSADAAFNDFAQRAQQRQRDDEAYNDSVNSGSRAQRLYTQAAALYRQHNYAEAYAAVNASLTAEPMREARILKSNILQQSANSTSDMGDKIAFWCAAYEAGAGYQEQRVLNQILSALDSHLFMSGLAGQTHSTRSPIQIRQRIWSMEQLRAHKQ